jgi:hypothetical protein
MVGDPADGARRHVGGPFAVRGSFAAFEQERRCRDRRGGQGCVDGDRRRNLAFCGETPFRAIAPWLHPPLYKRSAIF